MPWHYKANMLLKDLSYISPTGYEIYAQSNVSPHVGIITNSLPTYHMYGSKSTWLVDTGYAEDAAGSVTLVFNTPGIYTFDDMQIVAQTHEHFDEWVQQREKATLQNVEQGCNRLTGSIDLSENQTLLLTVAYSSGWTAYVDGEKTTLLSGDTGFMALDLTAGHHDIELRYQTPGLVAGFAVSGAGLVAVVVLAIVLRRRTK